MTRSWNSIVQDYTDLAAHQASGNPMPIDAMLDLVKSIEQSQYASGLYPWTSMHDLCIAQTVVEYPYQGPFLKILPTQNGDIEFRYYFNNSKPPQWVRVVTPQSAFSTLQQFLDTFKYFTTLK